jgi:hypothetical protein
MNTKQQTTSRPRRKARKIGAAVAVLMVLCVGSAAAYFLIFANSSGTATTNIGTSAAPTEEDVLSAAIPNGIKPGGTEPVVISAANPLSQAGQIKKMTIGVTSVTGTGCNPEWFSVQTAAASRGAEMLGAGLAVPVKLAAKQISEPINVAGVELVMSENGANQSACEGQKVTLALHGTP